MYVTACNIHFMCYNYLMKTHYKTTDTTISYITYHLVFCPRYRRKIFLIPGVYERFEELTKETCKDQEIEILSMEHGPDYVHLFVSVYPKTDITQMVRSIKYASSAVLRKEFEKLRAMPSLWTRCYFVTTEPELGQDTIAWYVEQQRKGY